MRVNYYQWIRVILIAVILSYGFAAQVFMWRNPTANGMSFVRDFESIVLFKKLDKYQAD